LLYNAFMANKRIPARVLFWAALAVVGLLAVGGRGQEKGAAPSPVKPLYVVRIDGAISPASADYLASSIARAKADGARAVLGGGANEELGGLYYRPTLLVDVPEGSEILTSEVFGPALTLQPFEIAVVEGPAPTSGKP
jgi:hypothetical protein